MLASLLGTSFVMLALAALSSGKVSIRKQTIYRLASDIGDNKLT